MSKKKTKKPKARMLKASFKLNIDYVVMVPPPTGFKDCPRCGKEHKKIKPLKFTKPMQFYGTDKNGKTVLTAQASHWLLCPKLKEPIILYDRYISADNIENFLVKSMAEDIAKHEDAKFLAEIQSFAKTNKLKKGKPLQQEIRIKYQTGKEKAWVYDPNAPERIVPGTKKEAAAQRARVRAQEKAAKGRKR